MATITWHLLYNLQITWLISKRNSVAVVFFPPRLHSCKKAACIFSSNSRLDVVTNCLNSTFYASNRDVDFKAHIAGIYYNGFFSSVSVRFYADKEQYLRRYSTTYTQVNVDYRKCIHYIECPTRYRTQHFFNNSNTNEDIGTKSEQEYVRCHHISYTMRQVRFKFRCNILISGKIIKEMPGFGSEWDTLYIRRNNCASGWLFTRNEPRCAVNRT